MIGQWQYSVARSRATGWMLDTRRWSRDRLPPIDMTKPITTLLLLRAKLNWEYKCGYTFDCGVYTPFNLYCFRSSEIFRFHNFLIVYWREKRCFDNFSIFANYWWMMIFFRLVVACFILKFLCIWIGNSFMADTIKLCHVLRFICGCVDLIMLVLIDNSLCLF